MEVRFSHFLISKPRNLFFTYWIMEFSPKSRIGIILIVISQPFGVVALLVCNAIALHQHNAFFSFLGIGGYALSWGMLGLGLLLAGKEGITYSRDLLKKLLSFLSQLASKSRRLLSR